MSVTLHSRAATYLEAQIESPERVEKKYDKTALQFELPPLPCLAGRRKFLNAF
jgi:hypothetical protein